MRACSKIASSWPLKTAKMDEESLIKLSVISVTAYSHRVIILNEHFYNTLGSCRGISHISTREKGRRSRVGENLRHRGVFLVLGSPF